MDAGSRDNTHRTGIHPCIFVFQFEKKKTKKTRHDDIWRAMRQAHKPFGPLIDPVRPASTSTNSTHDGMHSILTTDPAKCIGSQVRTEANRPPSIVYNRFTAKTAVTTIRSALHARQWCCIHTHKPFCNMMMDLCEEKHSTYSTSVSTHSKVPSSDTTSPATETLTHWRCCTTSSVVTHPFTFLLSLTHTLPPSPDGPSHLRIHQPVLMPTSQLTTTTTTISSKPIGGFLLYLTS